MLQKNEPFNDLLYPPIPADLLFAGLNDNDQDRLDAIMQKRHYKIDEQIFEEGDEAENVYLLKRGQAVLTRKRAKNASPLVCPVTPSLLFGVTEVLSKIDFEAGLLPVTDCEVGEIDREDFVSFFRSNPAACYRLASVVSSMYQKVVTGHKTQ